MKMKTFLLGAFAAMITVPGYGKALVSFADVAEAAIPGVVNIRTTAYISGKEAWMDPYQFFLHGGVPRPQSTSSLGTGFLVDNKGHLVTNHHVIEGANVVEILFAKSKRKVRAKLIGSDPKTDLALLQIPPVSDTHPLDLGDSDALRVGDLVLAIGNPFGYAHTVTSGIISAKGRVIGTGPYDNFLQTDAPIHPGNSGGPLLDVRGRVIGINTAVSAEGQGIGFAMPINMAKDVIRNLIAYGKVIRPWMGIVGKDILSRDEIESGSEAVGVYGVIIANLVVDGPSHKAGLRIGDLILTFDKQQIHDRNHLQRLLASHKPNEKIGLKIYRRSKGYLAMNMQLEDIPKAQDLPQEKDLF